MNNFCHDCVKKGKTCCHYDYAIFTTLKDLKRIENFLEVPIITFSKFDKLTKGDLETELYLKKIHKYYYNIVDSCGKLMQLKKKEDGSCIFINKNGLCDVYEVRPLICRVYPFWYSDENEIIIDGNGDTCPITCNTKNNLKDGKMVKKITMIGYSESELKKILMNLKSEIEDYSINIDRFLKTITL